VAHARKIHHGSGRGGATASPPTDCSAVAAGRKAQRSPDRRPKERLPDSSKRDRPSANTGRGPPRLATKPHGRRDAKRSELKHCIGAECEIWVLRAVASTSHKTRSTLRAAERHLRRDSRNRDAGQFRLGRGCGGEAPASN